MSDTDEPGSTETESRKSQLVCPTCGRTAPLDGDWAVTERDAGNRLEVAYECPECETVLVTQPQFGRAERAPPA